MNTTEALVAMLEGARVWDNPDGTRMEAPAEVLDDLLEAARVLDTRLAAGADVTAWLTTLGAAALWLLADEREPVTGRELDAWLADKSDAGTLRAEREGKGVQVHITSGPPDVRYVPVPVERPMRTTRRRLG